MQIRLPLAVVLSASVLCSCNSEVRQAEQELETVRDSQHNSPDVAANNDEMCRAYQKLADAYRKAGDSEKLRGTRVFVTGFCR